MPATPDRTLLEVLRHELDLKGSKYGCGEGRCGACTVLLAGAPFAACQVRLSEVASRPILTIEGVERTERGRAVQRAFAELGAFQCGYCTPGMVVGATALLDRRPRPSHEEILEALEGHGCRCGGYLRILAAVHRAAEAPAPGAGP